MLLVKDVLSSDPAAADLFFLDLEPDLKLDPESFLAFDSPHMLVPPWVDGMLRKVMPCRGGPSAKLMGTPSH